MAGPEAATDDAATGGVPAGGTGRSLRARADLLTERGRTAWEAVPLRARLVAILVALLAGALSISGAIVVNRQHAALMNDLDRSLERALHPMVSDAFRIRSDTEPTERRGPEFSSDYVAYPIWFDGVPSKIQRPAVSSFLPDEDPAFDRLAEMHPRMGEPFILGSTHGPAAWRVLGKEIQVSATGEPIGQIFVATPLIRVHDTVESLTISLTAVALGVMLAGGTLGWMLIQKSFRPLTEMEETAAAIAAGDLSRRIPPHPPTTEVGSLTASLNGMLAQIESAFRAREASEARTRRFAADASHELRTPLVSIRGFAELFRQGAVPADDVPRTMRRIEDEAKRMGSLVEDLLLLARLDEQRPGRKDPVDLLVLAGDAVHDAHGLDSTRKITLTGVNDNGPVPSVVIGDEDRLRQVVANLVANAVRHTPAGTPIEVGVGTNDAGDSVLEIRDHGPGLTDDQAQRVFERFYRVDSSRRRDTGGGSGLGLSIVAAVVASHTGQVEVVPTPGGGATFRVTLPVRATSPTPSARDDKDTFERTGPLGQDRR
ncbi:MAG: two-component system, OmpR family, sensor kinase [Actinomycetota bacterium]|nr:two-component system, OmpR family, sensor kinase [Actinomycetota bacterium]